MCREDVAEIVSLGVGAPVMGGGEDKAHGVGCWGGWRAIDGFLVAWLWE